LTLMPSTTQTCSEFVRNAVKLLVLNSINRSKAKVDRLTLNFGRRAGRVVLQAGPNQGLQVGEVLALAHEIGHGADSILRDLRSGTLRRARADLRLKCRNARIRVCLNQCKGKQEERREIRKEMHLGNTISSGYECEVYMMLENVMDGILDSPFDETRIYRLQFLRFWPAAKSQPTQLQLLFLQAVWMHSARFPNRKCRFSRTVAKANCPAASFTNHQWRAEQECAEKNFSRARLPITNAEHNRVCQVDIIMPVTYRRPCNSQGEATGGFQVAIQSRRSPHPFQSHVEWVLQVGRASCQNSDVLIPFP
jgi:hypothetical protein